MSTRRSRISEQEMSELVAKLHAVLPEAPRHRGSGKASAAKLLKETCEYIQSLQREVDGLSERLAYLIDNMDASSAQVEILRNLLRC